MNPFIGLPPNESFKKNLDLIAVGMTVVGGLISAYTLNFVWMLPGFGLGFLVVLKNFGDKNAGK